MKISKSKAKEILDKMIEEKGALFIVEELARWCNYRGQDYDRVIEKFSEGNFLPFKVADEWDE